MPYTQAAYPPRGTAETSEKFTRRPYAYYARARARARASKKRDTIGTGTTETGKDRSRSSFSPHLFLIPHVLRGGLAVIIAGVRISCGKGKGNGRIAESRRQRALKSTRLIIALHNVARSRIRDNSAPAEGRRGRANLPAPLPSYAAMVFSQEVPRNLGDYTRRLFAATRALPPDLALKST